MEGTILLQFTPTAVYPVFYMLPTSGLIMDLNISFYAAKSLISSDSWFCYQYGYSMIGPLKW